MELFIKNKQKLLEGFDSKNTVKIEDKKTKFREYDLISPLRKRGGNAGFSAFHVI